MREISIRLPDHIYECLKEIALKEKRSMNGQINLIIDNFLKESNSCKLDKRRSKQEGK